MTMRRTGPTSADVARTAGVSKFTVSRAFDPNGRIAADTRDKILKVASDLGYVPNLLARGLAQRRTNQVAIMVDDFGNPYKLPTLERLTAGLQAEGRSVMLVNIHKNFDHLEALTDARQRQVDAIVLFGTAFKPETLAQVQTGSGPPCYVLARHCDVAGVVSLHTAPEPAMIEIGEHLFRAGRRRPVFLAGPRSQPTAVGRRRTTRRFWQERGIELQEILAGSYDISEARRCVEAAFSAGLSADALICENDVLAIGALEALRGKLGLDVPGDISVTGFDNIELSGLPAFQLTTWHQPFDEMADTLVDYLVGRSDPVSVKLRGHLVVRATA